MLRCRYVFHTLYSFYRGRNEKGLQEFLLITLAALCLTIRGLEYGGRDVLAHFIQTLRTGYAKARKLSSIMPFGEFINLTDHDWKAI